MAKTSDAVEILDRVFVKGNPARRAAIDKEKALIERQYTPAEIEEHCVDLEKSNELVNAKPETSYAPKSLQILRQLQGELEIATRETMTANSSNVVVFE